jgi:membrane protease YdiL (CAAX protease family)
MKESKDITATNKHFAIENHPLRGCVYYLILTFFAQFFIENAFYAMCVVDLSVYLFVFVRRTVSPIKRPTYTVNTWIICILTALCLILTTYCWSRWYMTTIADASSLNYVSSMSEADTLVYLFMISVAAPLGEESLFRYIVLNGFFNSFKKFKEPVRYTCAIMLSAILFAVMHGTGVHLIVGFFCGLALAIVYCATNKLSVSIILHSLYNVGTLFVYVPSSLWLCVVLAIISFLLTAISIYNLSCHQLKVHLV